MINEHLTSRQKVKLIADRKNSGAAAFWIGNPRKDTLEKYCDDTKIYSHDKLYEYLKNDILHIYPNKYKHPDGKKIFNTNQKCLDGGYNNSQGIFAECSSIDEVNGYDWPDPDYMDYTEDINIIKNYQEKGILSGLWAPFFHVVSDFFGMQNYFIKMYSDPSIVEAVTENVVDFYVAANNRFYRQTRELTDYMFFGNDFGTQIDLLISPDCFNKFILPGMKRIIDTGKKAGKKIVFHSCGAIKKIIPDLIDLGIDILHPLQAKASGMAAEDIRKYKNEIAFMGGVDTQDLLMNSKPWQIKDEVHRLRDILGPNLIISPSHETLLPNVPFENVLAMAEAAKD